MEMEAVVEERTSLETQLASLRAQIDSFTSEVEEHKSKVNTLFFWTKVRFFRTEKKKKIQRNSCLASITTTTMDLQLNTNEYQSNTMKQQGWPLRTAAREPAAKCRYLL